jgi:hypothetical protein
MHLQACVLLIVHCTLMGMLVRVFARVTQRTRARWSMLCMSYPLLRWFHPQHRHERALIHMHVPLHSFARVTRPCTHPDCAGNVRAAGDSAAARAELFVSAATATRAVVDLQERRVCTSCDAGVAAPCPSVDPGRNALLLSFYNWPTTASCYQPLACVHSLNPKGRNVAAYV